MNNSQFDWQADEDEDLVRPSEQGERSRRNRRLWFAVAIFLLIGITSLLTVRYFNQRQRRLEEEMRQDVGTSFDLWHKAVEQQDGELYAHLLDGRDRNWQRVQKQLFEKDLILQRIFLSLSTNTGASSAPEVTLSPDWRRATVTYEQVYSAPPAADSNRPVRLRHTAVFEMRDSNWLQTAPDEDFWGDWETIETDLIRVHYPERDAELARQISQLLESDLRDICVDADGAGDRCAQLKPFMLAMSTAPESLAVLESAAGPVLPGANFRMPAPTIVGLPLDQPSFQVFYDGYTKILLEHVRTVVGSPTPLPRQQIRALCFNHPSVGPKLYKYDPAFGIWKAELPDRSFRFMYPLPDDQGLILDEMVREVEPWYSRLILRREGSEKSLLDEVMTAESYRVLSPASNGGSRLLLRRLADDQSAYHFSSLDLTTCDETGCDQELLPGYALWSPSGRQTILQIGSEIFLGGADGQIQNRIGRGFNPFWLDGETVAYIRFNEQGSRLTTELVTNKSAADEERVEFDVQDLAQAAGIDEDGLSIKYVTPNPANPNMLLVQASGLNDYAGEYFIFSVRLVVDRYPEGDPRFLFHLRREGSPGGGSGQVLPSGYLPFSVSPQGRWLMISELSGYDSATRTYLLVDLQKKETRIISESEPVFPAQFPSYDWSDDGRWLVIAGDGFFRLLAPEYGYEQLVPHDFDYCGLARWSD